LAAALFPLPLAAGIGLFDMNFPDRATPSVQLRFQIDQLEVERRRSIKHLNNLKRSYTETQQGRKHIKYSATHLQRINTEIEYTSQRILQIEARILQKETLLESRLLDEDQLDYLRWREGAASQDMEQKLHSASTKQYDVFISHATSDKDDFVRPLAQALRNVGISVWFDEFELKLGDSLRERIDYGLKNSRFGLVVLSASFFNRPWTDYELNSFVAREMASTKVILPIWHKVSKDEVLKFSPALADKVSLKSSDYSVNEIATEIRMVIG